MTIAYFLIIGDRLALPQAEFAAPGRGINLLCHAFVHQGLIGWRTSQGAEGAPIMQGQETDRRREAIEAAKLAVRAYAREPSDANAAEVEDAWRHVRKLQSVMEWRKPRS